MTDGPEWFAAKRYGYGAGLPISWQGWAVILGYLALIGLTLFVIPYSLIGFASIVIMLSAVLIVITARTTRGGWRWRWGNKE
jgi:hypothetical protein